MLVVVYKGGEWGKFLSDDSKRMGGHEDIYIYICNIAPTRCSRLLKFM